MKKLMAVLVLCSSVAWAQNQPSNDFANADSKIKALTVEDMLWRFHLTGEIFVLNKEGDKLINLANEQREWELNGTDKTLESNWRFQQKGLPLIALKQKWSLDNDGKFQVELSQYEDIERTKENEVKYGKLLKEDKFTLKNFAPIDWTINSGDQKVIVRLTPGMWLNQEAVDVESFPISVKNVVIYDRKGHLWADQVSLDNAATYFGVKTHQGSLFISFKPFKGAELLGEAKGSRIKVKGPRGNVFLQGEGAFVPRDVKVKVYGIVRPEIQSPRFGSVQTYSSSREEEFLKALDRK